MFLRKAATALPRTISRFDKGVVSRIGQVRASFSIVRLPAENTAKRIMTTRKRPDRAQIKEQWIKFVIESPEKTVIQSDGRIRKWSKITEVNKYLRAILLEDGTTVHNAFFDRSYKGE